MDACKYAWYLAVVISPAVVGLRVCGIVLYYLRSQGGEVL